MSRAWHVGLVLLALAAPLATAHTSHAGPRTFIVTAHDRETANGTVAWFAVDNRTQANPSPLLEPGQRVLVHLVNAGEANHSLALGQPVDRTVGPVAPGEEASFSFRVPADAAGEIGYRDPAWEERGMAGAFAINASSPQRPSPGPSLPSLALAGLGGLLLSARCRSSPP